MNENDAQAWLKQKALFQEALEREPGDRPAFLAEACGGDAALRGEVLALLEVHERGGEFMAAPPLEGAVVRQEPPPSRDPHIGRVLEGKYRIERRLGRGGMGSVYRATHLGTERPVAVKVIAPEFMANEEFVERFRREAKAAGRLRHPNVVNVTDFGFSGEGGERLAYLVMEYLDGQTLGDLLDERKQLPLAFVVDVVEQVALAVDEAHGQGIVHRDLKPANIWLQPTGRGGVTVKVLDFGLAKLRAVPSTGTGPEPPPASALPGRTRPDLAAVTFDDIAETGAGLSTGSPEGSNLATAATRHLPRVPTPAGINPRTIPQWLTRVGTVMGTPMYMSPEQCRGGALDAQSDVYSLGVVVYEMLTGETPFTGETHELLVKHGEMPPPRPTALRRDLPRAVESVVLAALAKSPADRPPTAGALAAGLRAAVGGDAALRAEAAELYHRHRELFLGIAQRCFIPAVVACYGLLAAGAFAPAFAGRAVVVDLLWVVALALLVLASLVCTAGCARAVDELGRQARVTPASALAGLGSKLGTFASTAGVGLVHILVGLVKLVRPGLRTCVRQAFLAPVVAVEGARGREALERSAALADRLAGLVASIRVREALIAVTGVIAMQVAVILMGLLALHPELARAKSAVVWVAFGVVALAVVPAALIVLAYPRIAIATALAYQRARQAGGESPSGVAGLDLVLEEEARPRLDARVRLAAGVAGLLVVWLAWVQARDVALFFAARSDSVLMVRALLAAGADPNARIEETSFVESAFELRYNYHIDETPLMTAITWAPYPRPASSRDIIRLLVEAGANVNGAPETRACPLAAAAMSGDSAEVIFLLLDAGADPNDVGPAGQAALTIVLWHELNVDVADRLIAKGANVNAKDDKGRTALMYAADSPKAIDYLLERGAAIDNRDTKGFSAFNFAIRGESYDGARHLAARGADVTFPNASRESALVVAAVLDDVAAARSLLAAGTSPDARILIPDDYQVDKPWEVSALVAAAGAGSNGVLELLLEHGADARGKDGTAALTAAISHARAESVRLLAAAGADPRDFATKTRNPYFFRRERRQQRFTSGAVVATLRALRDAGADARTATRVWRDAMNWAASHGDAGLIGFLVESGEPLDQNRATRLLMTAVEANNLDAARAFLAAGADPQSRSRDGSTALSKARRLRHEEMAALLAARQTQ